MLELLRDVDTLLRGRFTRREELAAGRIDVPVRRLVVAALAMGAAYGLFMGLFALLRSHGEGELRFDGWRQFGATMLKVPLLFLLTLLVTFPSLYVSSALCNSRLLCPQTSKLLLVAIGVDVALLASFGPVTGFFTVSTESYPFMVLLNVLIFAIAGAIGLGFLYRALEGVFHREERQAAPPLGAIASAARADLAAGTRRVFRIWIVIYAIVGAQMGWVLRPFVGDPRLPFTFFRPRTSNFFEACLHAMNEMLR